MKTRKPVKKHSLRRAVRCQHHVEWIPLVLTLAARWAAVATESWSSALTRAAAVDVNAWEADEEIPSQGWALGYLDRPRPAGTIVVLPMPARLAIAWPAAKGFGLQLRGLLRCGSLSINAISQRHTSTMGLVRTRLKAPYQVPLADLLE